VSETLFDISTAKFDGIVGKNDSSAHENGDEESRPVFIHSDFGNWFTPLARETGIFQVGAHRLLV
jgi:hypothetical protein